MKKNSFWKKNMLDERQEQVVLKFEHNALLIAYWGLLIAIFGQMFLYDNNWPYVAGEWIVFMVVSVYLLIASLKNGIWDRRLKPNFSTNLIVSIIAGVLSGVFITGLILTRYDDKPAGALAAGVISGGFIFVLCLVMLLTMSGIYKKRVQKLEEQEELE